MASRIIVLDEATASKIAAGEVVERPASIVKELVENSIDAGSAFIEIEIKGGGIDYIRVTDDGCGMSEEEACLSLERHSTSKIKTSDDLFSIKTLGFRGEALPSIASVSKMELISKELLSQSDTGAKLTVDGGKLLKTENAGSPYGTTIIIKDLFFNMPARLKFLKSVNTETAHITDIVSKLIICYPLISFRLISNEKEILSSPGKSELIEAISSLYGSQLAKNLLPVKYTDEMLNIYGYISSPSIDRTDRNMESFFVNGRYTKNILLSKAIEDPYRNIIPQDRYPIAAFFIEIDPAKIDVNVHPSKRDVKFSNTFEVTNAIKEAVKDRLCQVCHSSLHPANPHITAGAPENYIREELLPNYCSEEALPLQAIPFIQVNNTFIVTPIDDNLMIIDQHAAHERILFEKLMKTASSDISQKLLVPITYEVTPHEAAILEVNIKFLATIGFEIEVFGKNTFLIRAVPDILSHSNTKQTLQDIINEFISLERSIQFEVIIERIKKLVACHAAIKAGDKLSEKEVFKLLEDIKKTSNSSTCPHGRPTVKIIDKKELGKMFGRR